MICLGYGEAHALPHFPVIEMSRAAVSLWEWLKLGVFVDVGTFHLHVLWTSSPAFEPIDPVDTERETC